MKPAYKIKLYRSPTFRALCFCGLLLTAGQFFLLFYDLFAVGAQEYFFWGKSDPFLGIIAEPLGFANVFQFVLTAVLDLFFLYIFFLGAFVHKIRVREKDMFVFFAPCFSYRMHKVDICTIEPVSYSDLSKADKIFSWNFSKSDLYKFTCYDTTFVLCSKDADGMRRLMEEINPMRNPRACDEADYNPNQFTLREKIIIGVFGAVVFWILESIYYFFF